MPYAEDFLGENLHKKVKRITRRAYKSSPSDYATARAVGVRKVRTAVRAPRKEKVAVRMLRKRLAKRY